MDAMKSAAFVEEGGVLTMYLASGKKKHDRYFWVSVDESEGSCTLCWDKPDVGRKKSRDGGKANKSERLVSVEPAPAIRSARSWFELIDADGSGELDAKELSTLYKLARGEKLSKQMLKDAMSQMDTDGNGTVGFDEFSEWWRANGGDLEKYRPQALTVTAGDVQLLLVASSLQVKQQWIDGLRAVMGDDIRGRERTRSGTGWPSAPPIVAEPWPQRPAGASTRNGRSISRPQ